MYCRCSPMQPTRPQRPQDSKDRAVRRVCARAEYRTPVGGQDEGGRAELAPIPPDDSQGRERERKEPRGGTYPSPALLRLPQSCVAIQRSVNDAAPLFTARASRRLVARWSRNWEGSLFRRVSQQKYEG
eukprot:364046-Chlamydomonas_euryale.AAC.5